MEKWFGLTPEQVDLLKKLYPAAPEEQLRLFVYQAKRAGLDPLTNQIHLLERKRWNKETAQWESSWSIQTGIDGFRAVADRTGLYAPGRAPEIAERGDKIFAATAYVMKRVGDRWFEVSAVAYWDEYVQTNSKEQPLRMWQKMPRNQLSKCAEALALRKAFPAELSGIYTDDEMQQADAESVLHVRQPVDVAEPVVAPEPAPVQEAPAQESPGPASSGADTVPESSEKTAKKPEPPEPYEGQVIIAAAPEKKSRGWEVQAFDVLTDTGLTLVGPVETLQEGQVLRINGLRAKTKSGTRVKVEEFEIISETKPEPAAQTAQELTVKVTVKSAPKRGKKDFGGTLREIVWVYARTNDGRQVVVAGVDGGLETVAGFQDGQEVEIPARMVEENGKTVLYVDRAA